MKIGAQLFTVREFCKTENEIFEALKKIAKIGYSGVQISGVGPYDPARLRECCDQLNLQVALTHTSSARLKNDLAAVVKEHDQLGCRYIGLGSMERHYLESYENYKTFVAEYKPIAREIAAAGKLFMYHNHGFEWSRLNGRLVIERLAKDFSSDEMGFTLDTYWVQSGGGDPAAWIKKLSGRVPCVHFKDMAHTLTHPVMAPVMRGNLNWSRILEASRQSGVEWALVEQDDCNGENPFDCLKESYQNLLTAL